MTTISKPTPTEVLTALRTLAKVAHHVNRPQIAGAVKLLYADGVTSQQAFDLFESVGCAFRNLGEVIGEEVLNETNSHLKAMEYADAQASRVLHRAFAEFICSFDDAQDVANQRYIQMIGEEAPKTADEYEDCVDQL